MQTEILTHTLIRQTHAILSQIRKIKQLNTDLLTWRAHEDSWNILECLEHLNRYGDYYLPAMEQKIHSSSSQHDPIFKSGLLGGYFAKSMLPKKKLNKMKTFSDKNPLHAPLDVTVIDKSIAQQVQLLGLLNKSKHVSLNKIKIETSISRFIRLKLGDTFQFYINHIRRHMQQIEKIQVKYRS
jgi:hypothetical protein